MASSVIRLSRTRRGETDIQFQFRILRPLPPDKWVVQYYSFMSGEPNKLGVYSEEYLLSNQCALYPDHEAWVNAYADRYRD